MGQSIRFLQWDVSYFQSNDSLAPQTDIYGYHRQSLQVIIWIPKIAGHYFTPLILPHSKGRVCPQLKDKYS